MRDIKYTGYNVIISKMDKMDILETTKKYYSFLLDKGYIFYTNTKKTSVCKKKVEIYKEEFKKKVKGRKLFINDTKCILTGKIFVGRELEARWENGEIDPLLVPIFVKFKKVKKGNIC